MADISNVNVSEIKNLYQGLESLSCTDPIRTSVRFANNFSSNNDACSILSFI